MNYQIRNILTAIKYIGCHLDGTSFIVDWLIVELWAGIQSYGVKVHGHLSNIVVAAVTNIVYSFVTQKFLAVKVVDLDTKQIID